MEMALVVAGPKGVERAAEQYNVDPVELAKLYKRKTARRNNARRK